MTKLVSGVSWGSMNKFSVCLSFLLSFYLKWLQIAQLMLIWPFIWNRIIKHFGFISCAVVCSIWKTWWKSFIKMSNSFPFNFCSQIIQFSLISYLCDACWRTEVKVIFDCKAYVTVCICLHILCEGQQKLRLQFAVTKTPDCFPICLCDSFISICF